MHPPGVKHRHHNRTHGTGFKRITDLRPKDHAQERSGRSHTNLGQGSTSLLNELRSCLLQELRQALLPLYVHLLPEAITDPRRSLFSPL